VKFEILVKEELERFFKEIEASLLTVDIDHLYLEVTNNLKEMYYKNSVILNDCDKKRFYCCFQEGCNQLDSIYKQMISLQFKKRIGDKINRIVSYSKKISFSFKRKEKLLKYLKCNDLKLSSDEILTCIEFFKNSFSGCKWVGNYFLQQNHIFAYINDEKNRKEIIELCKFFNRKFVFDDFNISIYYRICGDVLLPVDFPELSLKEIKRFESYRKKEILQKGLILYQKDMKFFLQSLNIEEKRSYFNIIKNKWLNYSLDQLQTLLMTIGDWKEREFIDEFYNMIFGFSEKWTEYFLILVIRVLSKQNRAVLLEHQQEIINYLNESLKYSKKFIFHLLTVLKNEKIDGIEEFMVNNKDALIFQMVSSVYHAEDSKLDFSEVEPFLVKKIIEELLDFQNLNFSNLQFIGSGLLFSAYKLGEYVLKIGSHKLVSNCANTEEILQPFIRNQFGRVYIEVLPFLRTKNLDLAKIEKVRENLIRKKIDSSDLGDNNFGVLEHPVKVFKMRNDLSLAHQNVALDFSGREVGKGYLTEDLYEVGKYYILDSDLMWQHEDKDLRR